MLASPPRILRFDEFTLDCIRGVLLRGGTELPLRRQSFEVLRYLAERAGEVVSSEELIEVLWSSKPADSNASVVQCIKEIRRAIGHDARWIIKTVSGSGYEFMAAVVPFVPPPPEVAPSTVAKGTPDAGTAPAAERPSWRLHRLLVVALIVALLPVGWMLWRSQQAPGPQSVLTMMAAPTIAVLPFATLGPEHGLEAGLEAEIRSELARAHRGFDLVIKSASDDRDRSASPKIAGARLGARYVVVGTMSVDLDGQRANIRLIESETDRQIWSEPFEFKRGQSGAPSSAGGSRALRAAGTSSA
jgi:DNA-binding winged helix-turn-helix (wHTH) protein/TolB-like protein